MPPLIHQPADVELVRRILEETGVDTKPAGPPLMAYFGAWMEAIMRFIGKFFENQPGLAKGILNVVLVVAILTVALALALVVISIVRLIQARGPRGGAVPRLGWVEVPEGGPPRRDRLAWKAEIEARLARGDVAGALEAFWWWLASSLPLESDIDESWTTRELLVRSRRRELLGLGARLDVLMYGPRVPSPEDVVSCLARFEEKLA